MAREKRFVSDRVASLMLAEWVKDALSQPLNRWFDTKTTKQKTAIEEARIAERKLENKSRFRSERRKGSELEH